MNASELRCGESHEFAKTWAKAGGEIAEITAMTQNVRKCRQVIAYLRGEAELVAKKVEKGAKVSIEKTICLMKEVGKVVLHATEEKETKESFKGDRYYYRAPEFDSWLPPVQSAGKEGEFTVYQLEKGLMFREIAVAILGWVDETSNLDLLAKALIENGHTVVLSQIESLIERTEVGEETGLRTDGWGNFFFVQTKEEGVAVVYVGRGGGQWRVDVRRFGYGYRWDVERRFFSRN